MERDRMEEQRSKLEGTDCELKEAEALEVAELFETFITPYFPEDEVKPLEIIEELVANGLYKVLYLEMAGEKKGIAFLNAYPECGSYLLDYLAVHESCRGEGYGSILLKKCGQLLDGKPMLIETEAVFAAQNEAEKQERIQRNQFYQKNGARMTDACIRMFGVIFTMWTLYDEVGLTKAEIEQEMERHYRYMLMDTALYEANAEIPYEE